MSARPTGRPAGPTISTGSGDPSADAPTANLDAVTEPFLGRDGPAAPPARPRFEFRPPPSAESAPRPGALSLSSLLWIVGAGMLLVAVVLPMVGVGDLWTDVAALVNRDFPNELPATRDRVTALVTLTLVGSGVLLALVAAGAAAAMRGGRPFARILLALLIPLVGLHALLMVGVAPAPSVVLLGANLTLGLVAGVLMFLPGMSRWLAQPRRG